MGIFSGSQTRQAPAVPTDEVIPLRFWDTALSMRGTVLDIALKFDDVLDTRALRDSLDKLFEIDGWRQLGARLRMNVSTISVELFDFVFLIVKRVKIEWTP